MKQLFRKSISPLLFLFAIGMVFIPQYSFAAEAPGGGGGVGGGDVSYTVSLDKSSYLTQELMDISVSSVMGVCNNTEVTGYELYGQIYYASSNLAAGSQVSLGDGSIGNGIPYLDYFIDAMSTPSTPDDYYIKLTFKGYTGWNLRTYTSTTVINKPFTVTGILTPPPPPPTPKTVTVYAKVAGTPDASVTPVLNVLGMDKTIEVTWKPSFDVTSCTCTYNDTPGCTPGVGSCLSCGSNSAKPKNVIIMGGSYATPVNTTFNVSCSDSVSSSVSMSEKCYTGIWPDPDAVHPDGGRVTYTAFDGKVYTESGIFLGGRVRIEYITGTPLKALGVEPIDCPVM